jgi:murein tripeptide amidase MpaA
MFGPAGLVRAEGPMRFDGYRIARVTVQTQAELEALSASAEAILNCVPGIGPMEIVASPAQLRAIEALGLPTVILEDDIQRRLDAERAARTAVVAGGDPFGDFFLAYQPYGDFSEVGTILWYLGELAAQNPGLASLVEIGTTLQGRTIWGLRISNDSVTEKPAVVYFGCEHAREWIACPVPLFFATHVLANYGIDPAVTELVDGAEFFVIPVFNVDGYLYSWDTYRFWRKNRRNLNGVYYGVDLNRNWAEGWGGPGSEGNYDSPVYRGSAPFSEPETQELRDFFLAHPNIRAQMDIHSFGEQILWPYGYTSVLPPDQAVYAELGATLRALILGVHGRDYDKVGTISNALYPASGVSIDWTYAQRDVLSFTLELRPDQGGGLIGFDPSPDELLPVCEEILPAMLEVAQSEWVYTPLKIAYSGPLPVDVQAGRRTAASVDIRTYFGSVAADTPTLYYRLDPSDPFSEVRLARVETGRYEGVLPAMNCWSTPELYFGVASSTGAQLTDPVDAPGSATFTATVRASDEPFWRTDLNFDPGWVGDGAWAWGRPLGMPGELGADPTSGFTGEYVLGYNLDGDYANGVGEQHVTTPAIDCSMATNVTLSFRRWLVVDAPPMDHASVSVSTDGADWTIVWANEQAVVDESWTEQILDLSDLAAGRSTVYLRWTMGPTDATVTGSGWNLDDVHLHTESCISPPGDVNGDNAVDLSDAAKFLECFSGDAEAPAAGCRSFDTDGNGTIGGADWPAIHASFSGPYAPTAP